MKGINKNKILAITFIFSSLMLLASTQFPPWDVPAEANDIANPTEVNKKSLEEGKAFYDITCKACHGEKALGDGVIPSANLTTKAFSDQTDGAIFFKMQQGRGQMPAFKALAESKLWYAINYIRSLAGPAKEVILKDAALRLEFQEAEQGNFAAALVYEILENGDKLPLKGVKVNFYIKRYFADLPIGGNNNYSDENGSVMITFPEEIPGEDGILEVVARIEDAEYTPAETEASIGWGTEKAAYWNDDRALWKNNEHVPWWVLFSYFGISGGVMLTILYVLLQVRKISKLGKVE